MIAPESLAQSPAALPIPDIVAYAKLVVLATIAWIIRELVLKRDHENLQRARAILSNRLEKAYGPVYYLTGDLLQALLSGRKPSSGTSDELRGVLSAHSHHLRDEHLRFCADLLAGWRPTSVQVLWHRHSVKREIDKLRLLLYGPAAELEAALERGALAVMLRLAFRLGDYLLATAFWFCVFAGMAIIVLEQGSRERWLLPTLI